MALSITYDPGTNVITVSGHTGIRLDWILNTDRLGTFELKAATTPAAGMTVTDQVRPADLRAIKLDLIVAGANPPGAGDTIDVYGTDERACAINATSASGQTFVKCAQTFLFAVGDTVRMIDVSSPTTTETGVVASIVAGARIVLTGNLTNTYTAGDWVGVDQQDTGIDVSGGNAIYTTNKRFSRVAYWDCTGWAGGTVQLIQNQWGVIWGGRLSVYGSGTNRQYVLDASLQIGNGVTATKLSLVAEDLFFNGGCAFTVKANATFQCGTKTDNDTTKEGCHIVVANYTANITHEGSIYLYGTVWKWWSGAYGHGLTVGSYEFINTLFEYVRISCPTAPTLLRIRHCRWHPVYVAIASPAATTLDLDDITIDTVDTWPIQMGGAVNPVFRHIVTDNATKPDAWQMWNFSGAAVAVDCAPENWGVYVDESSNSGSFTRKYSFNIHVADPDGTDLENVTAVLVDKDANEIFSESTDAGGDIAEQEVAYEQYTDGGATADTAEYHPHVLTLSHASYGDLVIDNIDLSDAAGGGGLYGVKWHLEMPGGGLMVHAGMSGGLVG